MTTRTGERTRPVRIPLVMLEQADELAVALAASRAYGWLGKQQAAAILRLAAQKGLEQLRAELGAEPPDSEADK